MRLSDRCYAVTGLSYKFPPVVNAGFIVGDHETLDRKSTRLNSSH